MYELNLCFYLLCASIDYVIPSLDLSSFIIDLISYIVSWSIANNMAKYMLPPMPVKISVDDILVRCGDYTKQGCHNCRGYYVFSDVFLGEV